MSVNITTAFVEQYKSNVYHLTQQKGSRLRQTVRTETVNGRSAFFEQIGATAARERVSRHSDTPRMDTPHSRRRVTVKDFDWADMVDNEDQIRMLYSPASPYAEAAAMALGRTLDDIIISAADATAFTGVDGSTSTAFDTGMVVGVQTRWPGATAANLGLNLAKLLEAKNLLGTGNVDQDDELWCIVNTKQAISLLKDTRIASADYNNIKPLVDGKVGRAAGFNIISTERIGVDSSGYNKVLFWAKGGMLLGMGNDIETKITERADKNYATQVFAAMTAGATRMEEARVGYITCDLTGGPGA